MRSFTRVLEASTFAEQKRLTLPRLVLGYHERRRTRFGVTLDGGEDVGVALPRGTVLKPGDLLGDEAGGAVRVEAAAETVSVVRSADTHRLMRAAYHLGNRHVALQIALDELAYLHDHVLDGMVRALGLEVEVLARPFEAEPGPYGSDAAGPAHGGHGHDHGHEHGHAHGGHDHAHGGHGHAEDPGHASRPIFGRARRHGS